MQFGRKSYKCHTQAYMTRSSSWGGKAFGRSFMEQDLRETVEHKPNVSQHCHAVVKKANIILERINSSISCVTHENFLLFLASVRPQL